MNMQKPSSQLVANKWHPQAGDGIQRYPSPQSVLRACLGESQYKFVSETVTAEHIRAACVLPLGIPFSHLMDVPWAMNYRASEWRMIIVSTLDAVRWIDLARSSGAIGWLKAANLTITYNWEKPPLDEHNCKIRPPNALGSNGHSKPPELRRTDFASQKKSYDREDLLADLRAGILTRTQIAEKHNLSRNRIHILARQEGIIIDSTKVPNMKV